MSKAAVKSTAWRWLLRDHVAQLVAALVVLDLFLCLSGVVSDEVLWALNYCWYTIHISLALVVIRQSVRRKPQGDELFWNLLSVALLLWWCVALLGMLEFGFFNSPLGLAIFDTLMIAFYFVVLTANGLRPEGREKALRVDRLELGGVAFFLLMLLAYFTLLPAFFCSSSPDLLYWLASPLFVVLDLYLAATFFLAARRTRGTRWSYLYTCFSGTALLWAVTDTYDLLSTFPYADVDPGLGAEWFFLWHLALPLLILGSRFREYQGSEDRPVRYRWQGQRVRSIHRLLLLAMMLPVLHMVIFSIARPTNQDLVWSQELVAVLSMMGLMGLVVWQHQRLTRQYREAVEEQQRISQQLRHTESDLRQFIGSFSHDLRSPLVNLLGFAGEMGLAMEELEQELEAPVPDRQRIKTLLQGDLRECVEMIESSSVKMDRFVTALLMLGRSGQRDFIMTSVDLKAIGEEVLQGLQYRISKREVKVTLGELPMIVSDELAVTQIFTNLLSNAVKYLSPERPGVIEVDAQQVGTHTVVRFLDNGLGVEEDDIPKMFQPFRRLRIHEEPGEGIGLTHVQLLVRRLGGEIHCISDGVAGCCFEVWLPYVQLLATQDPPRASAVEERAKATA
ncbi:MAG: HAMP domain-containing sensor histidine kinase [Acidobacteriota bacterium]